VIFVPPMPSLRIGKIVPMNTVNAVLTNSTFCSRKMPSRENAASSVFSLLSVSRRVSHSAVEAMSMTAIAPMNHGPMSDAANACTLVSRPLRMNAVPKNMLANVTSIRNTFQFLNMPRFSWIICECRKAVHSSQVMNGMFSLGSQPQ